MDCRAEKIFAFLYMYIDLLKLLPYAPVGFDLTTHMLVIRDDTTRQRRQGCVFFCVRFSAFLCTFLVRFSAFLCTFLVRFSALLFVLDFRTKKWINLGTANSCHGLHRLCQGSQSRNVFVTDFSKLICHRFWQGLPKVHIRRRKTEYFQPGTAICAVH
jgi:hypothetical protein